MRKHQHAVRSTATLWSVRRTLSLRYTPIVHPTEPCTETVLNSVCVTMRSKSQNTTASTTVQHAPPPLSNLLFFTCTPSVASTLTRFSSALAPHSSPPFLSPLVVVGERDLSQRKQGRRTVLRRELDLDGGRVGLAPSGLFLSLPLSAEPLLLVVQRRLGSQPFLRGTRSCHNNTNETTLNTNTCSKESERDGGGDKEGCWLLGCGPCESRMSRTHYVLPSHGSSPNIGLGRR